MADEADVVLYAPSEELTDTAHIVERDLRMHPNADYPGGTRTAVGRRRPQRRRKLEHPALDLYAGYDGLLVRTAIIRAEGADAMVLPFVQSSDAAATLLKHLIYADQEHLVTIALNGANEVMAIHEAAIGTTSSAEQTTRNILKIGFLTGASAIIIAHNHPSGNPTPSKTDMRMTSAIMEAATCIGLPLLDALVVARDGFTSIREVVRSWTPRGLVVVEYSRGHHEW